MGGVRQMGFRAIPPLQSNFLPAKGPAVVRRMPPSEPEKKTITPCRIPRHIFGALGAHIPGQNLKLPELVFQNFGGSRGDGDGGGGRWVRILSCPPPPTPSLI